MKYDLSKQTDVNKAKFKFEQLIEGKSKIELTKKRESRTLDQNSYLHVCITLYGINSGHTIAEAKTLLKRECDFMRYKKNDITFLVETSKSDTKLVSQFTEWIRNHAAQEGCYIPTPEEYITNRFEIEREIEACKVYL